MPQESVIPALKPKAPPQPKDSSASGEEPQVHPAIQKKLEEIQQGVTQQAALSQILQNPVISQALQLLNSGKKIKIVDEAAEPAQAQTQPQVDLDELDNKSLVAHMERNFESKIQGILEKNQSPLLNRLDMITQHLQQEQVNRQVDEIAAFKKTVKDFDQLTPDIMEIRKTNQGLGIDELYLIAKKRKLGTAAFADTFSERPTQASTPPPAFDSVEIPAGKRGISSLVGLGIQHAMHSVKKEQDVEL